MSITVIIARDDVGAPTTREIYEAGAKFTTEGGDLSIISARPQLLATYGSGNWLSVHVDDNVEVITTKSESGDDDDAFGFGDDSDSAFGDDDSSTDDDSSDDSSSDDDASASFGDDESSADDAGTDDD
jgi:hypothetical protein